MLYKSKTFELLELLDIVGLFLWVLYYCGYMRLLETGFMHVFYLGRAPYTKETLPDFLK